MALSTEVIAALNAHMARQGMTRTALAEALAVRPPGVTRMLSGQEPNLTLDRLERVADALGLEARVVFRRAR